MAAAGWTWGQMPAPDAPLYLQATTATLRAITVLQIVHVFLCRSSVRALLSTGLGGNRLIIGGVVLEAALLLLIAYTPWGNRLFGTAAPPSWVWLYILPFALLVLVELRKACAPPLVTSSAAGLKAPSLASCRWCSPAAQPGAREAAQRDHGR